MIHGLSGRNWFGEGFIEDREIQWFEFQFLKDADGILLQGEKPTEIRKEGWNLLDHKALDAIRLTLSKLVAFNIKTNNTTSFLMVSIFSIYEQLSAAN